MSYRQRKIALTILRGGTSKGVYLHEKNIPPSGHLRDAVLKRIMGTPDPLQLDGLGGSNIVTSKVAIIKKSTIPNIDVDYTFAQAGTKGDTIEYDANCGNISSGVGPFAIDEGLIETFREGKSIDKNVRTQEVRIYNTGTKKTIISHVPIDYAGGTTKSVFHGDYSISGVPGTGAPILIDWKETAGANQGRGLLPTGNAIDIVNIRGKDICITICDIGNICVFVNSKDVPVLNGSESPQDFDNSKDAVEFLAELKGKACQKFGLTEDWKKCAEKTMFVPFIGILSPPKDNHNDIASRLILMDRCHTSYAGTGAVCTAACSRIPGTVVNKLLSENSLNKDVLKIEHPSGVMPVLVKVDKKSEANATPLFEVLAFVRTARRIMDGSVYIPEEVWK